MSPRSLYGGRGWTLTSGGVVVDGSGRPARTKGVPRTMRLYMACWADELRAASEATRVPLSLLLMTIATENGPARVDENRPHVIPWRKEPGYTSDQATPHRISFGPCHVLISTARAAMGDQGIDRAWCLNVANNILAAARYIAGQRQKTGFDPILVAAAYNAGGLYPAPPGDRWHNPWHIRTFGSHLDRAAAWYGDAVAVLEESRALVALDAAGLGRVG